MSNDLPDSVIASELKALRRELQAGLDRIEKRAHDIDAEVAALGERIRALELLSAESKGERRTWMAIAGLVGAGASQVLPLLQGLIP